MKTIAIPYAPNYLFDRYKGQYFDARRYGTRSFIVKFLDRELENR